MKRVSGQERIIIVVSELYEIIFYIKGMNLFVSKKFPKSNFFY